MPFDVRVGGGKFVRLITMTPLPNKPWSYTQKYSFKPVPPPEPPARAVDEEAEVSDAMKEVLEILNRDREAASADPERHEVMDTSTRNADAPASVDTEVRGVAIPQEPQPAEPGAPSVYSGRTAITRSPYIPAGVSDEFGHARPASHLYLPPPSPSPGAWRGAYIPETVSAELNRQMPAGTVTRTTTSTTPDTERVAPTTKTMETSKPVPQILGLRTVAYRVPDLSQAKDWYARAFGTQPYFDEPFYVGFDIGGYELGLQPIEGSPPAPGEGSVTYWGVPDVEASLAHFVAEGATPFEPVQDVGGGIKVAAVKDPWGNVIGLIYNPHFRGK